MQSVLDRHDATERIIDRGVVRSVVARAWRMRGASSINWGVRDWSRLDFLVEREGLETTVTIIGACEDSGLRHYVWEQLGGPSRVTVQCREQP